MRLVSAVLTPNHAELNHEAARTRYNSCGRE